MATVFEDVKGLLQRREMNCSLYFQGSGELRDLKDREIQERSQVKCANCSINRA